MSKITNWTPSSEKLVLRLGTWSFSWKPFVLMRAKPRSCSPMNKFPGDGLFIVCLGPSCMYHDAVEKFLDLWSQ